MVNVIAGVSSVASRVGSRTRTTPQPTSHRRCSPDARPPTRAAARGPRPRAAPGRRGAAWPGARARWCGHRQDPGDHPPDRARGRDGRLPALRGAGGHLHHPGGGGDAGPAALAGGGRGAGPHLPLRGAAPAAVLLAPRPRHRAADPHRVQARAHGDRRPPLPGQRRPGAAARPRLRGRVGQGLQRPPRRLRPGRADPRPVGRRSRPRDGGPRVLRLRGRQARSGPHGHGGRAALHRRPARRRRAGRCPGPVAVQALRRRRVPGRLPAPVGAARPVARRPRRDLRRGRPGPDDLLLRRCPRRPPHRLREEVPGHDLRRAGPQLPLHPRGGRRRQPAARRQPEPGGPAPVAAVGRAGRRFPRPPRRGGRGRLDRGRATPTR